jgi:hypothetical protein
VLGLVDGVVEGVSVGETVLGSHVGLADSGHGILVHLQVHTHCSEREGVGCEVGGKVGADEVGNDVGVSVGIIVGSSDGTSVGR